MKNVLLGIALLFISVSAYTQQDVPKTTRIENVKQHERKGADSYPFRTWSDYIVKELDMRTGDHVLDVGSGDGWWIDQFLQHAGESVTFHALEVEDDKVTKLQEKYKQNNNVHSILAPETGTGLQDNSIDLVFFSQVYHHLPEDGHIDYLKHLRSVVKKTGRVCIIEKYTEIATRNPSHGTQLSELITQAEAAGWILLRYELIPNTYHYLTFFAQKEMFPPKPKEEKEEPKELTHTNDSVDEIKAAIKNGKAIIVDVREQNEWDDGHLKDAQLLPLSVLTKIEDDENAMKEAVSILMKDKVIYTHCRRGGRALRAGKLLLEKGYDVRPLPLGFDALVKKGFEQAE